MLLKLKSGLLSLSISKKIMASMFFIVLVLCTFLTMLTNKYFTKLYLEDTYEKSNLAINVSEQALMYTYFTILDNVNEFVSSNSFQKTISNSLKTGLTTSNKADLQEGLFSLNHSSPYIDSGIVMTKGLELIYHFNQTLHENFSVIDYFNDDLNNVNGITFFPIRESPFTKGNEIIPMVFPIKQLSKDGYFYVVDNYNDAEVFIVLFLSVYELEKILKFSSNESTDSKLILSNETSIINIGSDSSYYEMVKNIVFQEDRTLQKDIDTTMIYEGNEYMIFSKAFEYSDLHLINIVSKNHVIHRLDAMRKFMFVLAITGILFATFLSLLLSNFLTKPFARLMDVIKKISDGEYDHPNQTLYNDEVGRLNDALNFMHSTIQRQFSDIKDKESAKFQAELNLLSEQVNPHFLYNTLECINMEILCKHNNSASEMISHLSSFLRIGLNYGNIVILFNDEVKHAQSYLNIMNYRHNHKISFTEYIEEGLKEWKVIKYILQPLIENSIIHGFGKDMHLFVGSIPEITINAYIKDNMVVIEVNDNGIGIDIEKAEEALKGQGEDNDLTSNHFGLYSVYQRLRHYYGDQVNIQFESIPMFKNSVMITLPFKS